MWAIHTYPSPLCKRGTKALKAKGVCPRPVQDSRPSRAHSPCSVLSKLPHMTQVLASTHIYCAMNMYTPNNPRHVPVSVASLSPCTHEAKEAPRTADTCLKLGSGRAVFSPRPPPAPMLLHTGPWQAELSCAPELLGLGSFRKLGRGHVRSPEDTAGMII